MQDLPFKRGETLVIISSSKDPNWYKARRSDGLEGMIPYNYVQKKKNPTGGGSEGGGSSGGGGGGGGGNNGGGVAHSSHQPRPHPPLPVESNTHQPRLAVKLQQMP